MVWRTPHKPLTEQIILIGKKTFLKPGADTAVKDVQLSEPENADVLNTIISHIPGVLHIQQLEKKIILESREQDLSL